MLTTTRRLAPVLLAVLLLLPVAGTAAAYDQEPVTDAILAKSGTDLALLMNRQRAQLGLVPLQIDPDLMAIARARANVMAANDVMSHTEPNGQKVFDRLTAAGITWYGAGEILAWNHYPTEALSVAEAIHAWMLSPDHRDIIVSTGYNYVGFGAAVSATGLRYYAGVFVKEPDETGAWAKFGTISKRSVLHHRVRVTIRWSGADTRLQVLTSGLRYFEVQRRRVGGRWYSWGVTTATHRTITWLRPYDHQVRVRARDRAGNWGPWKVIRINL
ncbi:MAG TPA: CAP domain-containing protein [Candidatus Limnocylindrales bacterium]|nr:CAP domain-containing protein [Candidatus Limnocylindrales bacterium]